VPRPRAHPKVQPTWCFQANIEEQRWPKKWGDPKAETKAFSFDSTITLRGGEYFFAPSLPFLKSLQGATQALSRGSRTTLSQNSSIKLIVFRNSSNWTGFFT